MSGSPLVRRIVRDAAMLGGVAAAGVLAGRRAEEVWQAAADPIGPGELVLPDGEDRTVLTDDGAELAVRLVGSSRGSGKRRRSRRAGSDPSEPPAGRAPPTVVLAHGWAVARASWAPVAHRLVAAGHPVVLYDQRGHGASTPGSAAPSVARLGDDVAVLLEQLGLDHVVLAGHSMGGFGVMAFAADHLDLVRERVRGLALISTAAHGLGVGRLNPVMARLVASGAVDWALARPRLGVYLVRGAVGRHPRYAHLTATRDQFLGSDRAVRAALFTAFGSMDLRAGIAQVEVYRAVVMTGGRDVVTPPRLGRAVAASLPQARFELVSGAGHMLILEEPDRVAAAIAGLRADATAVVQEASRR